MGNPYPSNQSTNYPTKNNDLLDYTDNLTLSELSSKNPNTKPNYKEHSNYQTHAHSIKEEEKPINTNFDNNMMSKKNKTRAVITSNKNLENNQRDSNFNYKTTQNENEQNNSYPKKNFCGLG